MKKILAFCLVTFVPVIILSGCLKKIPLQPSSPEQSPQPGNPPSQNEPAEPEKPSPDLNTPNGAAEKLLGDIVRLDDEKIRALTQEYFTDQIIPEEYYSILKPISERVSYKIGDCTIDGDIAMVDVSITSVDAQSAFNTEIPGALAHLAVMQVAGKNVSNPEKILAEYMAQNIEWDNLPTIKTNTTLHLIRNEDGEWKVDMDNPGNLDFANAISGGAIEVSQNLKKFADRFR